MRALAGTAAHLISAIDESKEPPRVRQASSPLAASEPTGASQESSHSATFIYRIAIP